MSECGIVNALTMTDSALTRIWEAKMVANQLSLTLSQVKKTIHFHIKMMQISFFPQYSVFFFFTLQINPGFDKFHLLWFFFFFFIIVGSIENEGKKENSSERESVNGYLMLTLIEIINLNAKRSRFGKGEAQVKRSARHVYLAYHFVVFTGNVSPPLSLSLFQYLCLFLSFVWDMMIHA